MFDYGNGFAVGDWNITIGGLPNYLPTVTYPGTVGTVPGTVPAVYQVPASNANNQILMIGLVLLAVVLLTRK